MKRTIITVVLVILILCALFAMGYAGYNAYKINQEYKEARDAYKNVADDVIKIVERDQLHDNSVNNTEESGVSISAEYLRLSPFTIEVDFDKLLSVNSDIVGWLYYEGGLNYPVVQGNDNSYYLHRFYDKSYSYSGIPFMDCRMARDFSDKINLIYGHNMRDGSMFNVLQKYKDEQYFRDFNVIQLATPEKNYLLHVLSCKVIKQTDDFYDLNDDCLDQYLTDEQLGYDKYVVLSTCSYEYNGARTIVICWAEEVIEE